MIPSVSFLNAFAECLSCVSFLNVFRERSCKKTGTAAEAAFSLELAAPAAGCRRILERRRSLSIGLQRIFPPRERDRLEARLLLRAPPRLAAPRELLFDRLRDFEPPFERDEPPRDRLDRLLDFEAARVRELLERVERPPRTGFFCWAIDVSFTSSIGYMPMSSLSS
jgi:hypothetical protein